MTRRLAPALLAILLLGLALRLTGLKWGLPDQGRFYHGMSYHPDEQSFFYGLKQLSWSEKRFYPTDETILAKGVLQLYEVGMALGIASPFLQFSSSPLFYQEHPEALARIYGVARLLSVFQSLLAIGLLFWLGKLCWGWKEGLLAALFMAITPLLVVNAHYISTDSAFSLYLIALAIACWFIAQNEKPWPYLVAGFFWGMLAANKYNAATSGILILMTHLMAGRRRLKPLLIAGGGAVMGFLICSPVTWLSWPHFVAGLRHAWKMNLYLDYPLSDVFYPRSAVRFYFWDAPLYAVGLPLWIACVVGLLQALKKQSTWAYVWFLWLVIFSLSLMGPRFRLTRWLIPLMPFLFLLAARFCVDLIQRRKTLGWIITTSIALFTLCTSGLYVQAMAQPDTRDIASDWIAENIPSKQKVGLVEGPFAWDPAIIQQDYHHSGNKYDWVRLDKTVPSSPKEWPRYVVLTDYHAGIYLQNSSYHGAQPYGQLFKELFNSGNYRVAAQFSKRLELGGLDWYGAGRLYPHDWRYPFPTVYILERLSPRRS